MGKTSVITQCHHTESKVSSHSGESVIDGGDDDGPARVPVDQHNVCGSPVMEEIRTDVLKGVLWLLSCCGGHCRLRWGVDVTYEAAVSGGSNV